MDQNNFINTFSSAAAYHYYSCIPVLFLDFIMQTKFLSVLSKAVRFQNIFTLVC